MKKFKIGIIGATGYTGSELVRWLQYHPAVTINAITSESRTGELFSDVHSSFAGVADFRLISAADALEMSLDLVFLALPHGVSMKYARMFLEKNIPVVDLSGDFRLSSAAVYTHWYNKTHTYPEGLEMAEYGMPELNRVNIAGARLVACPGCYPTGSILPLTPLLKKGVIRPGSIIIDAKSGTTGAGVKASETTHFSNVNDNFRAYGLKNHRHTVEIEEKLQEAASHQTSELSRTAVHMPEAGKVDALSHKPQAGTNKTHIDKKRDDFQNGTIGPVQFTPHLLPVDRGILSTIYAEPSPAATGSMSQPFLNDILTKAYVSEPFIRVGQHPPSLKDIRGTNLVRIYADFDERTNRIILVSAIDNLVKGSSGQAIQCMNLMLGLPEATALQSTALYP